MWNLKYDTNEPMKTKQNHQHREKTGDCQRWAAGGGMDWESGVSRYKLLYIEWTLLLHSTENYIQYPTINQNGKEKFLKKKRVYIYICIFAIQPKLIQHCKSTIVQFKKKDICTFFLCFYREKFASVLAWAMHLVYLGMPSREHVQGMRESKRRETKMSFYYERWLPFWGTDLWSLELSLDP